MSYDAKASEQCGRRVCVEEQNTSCMNRGSNGLQNKWERLLACAIAKKHRIARPFTTREKQTGSTMGSRTQILGAVAVVKCKSWIINDGKLFTSSAR